MSISTAHNKVKRFLFWFLAVLISIFLKIGLQKPYIWSKMEISLFKAYFVGHFCYHGNDKIYMCHDKLFLNFRIRPVILKCTNSFL